MPSLFDPLQMGELTLANRVVMAPLTRSRCPGGLPTAQTLLYYTQRASAGLIISEGMPISPEGDGYPDTPGLYTALHVRAWQPITAAVHAAGGRMAAQLWHVGRVLRSGFVAPTGRTVSASALPVAGRPAPHALSTSEIGGVVAQFAQAARLAIEAGFDAVEVHGANGYLIEQFLRDCSNHRQDEYGGTLAQRLRFPLDVMQAVAEAVGPARVGLRISPVSPMHGGAQDSQPQALYEALAQGLSELKLAFLHVVEGQTGGARDILPFDYSALRQRFSGRLILNNGYERATALAAVAEGRADMVAFGRAFIANPDLVRRLRLNAPLQSCDASTLYGGTERGYTDYAFLRQG